MPNINNTGSTSTTANTSASGHAPSASESAETPNTGTTTPVETPPSIQDIHDEFATDGWTDEELKTYIDHVVSAPEPREHLSPLWAAVLNPKMPDEEHQDQKFFEVLSWYIDKSTSGRGDGQLSLREVEEQLAVYGQRYCPPAKTLSSKYRGCKTGSSFKNYDCFKKRFTRGWLAVKAHITHTHHET